MIISLLLDSGNKVDYSSKSGLFNIRVESFNLCTLLMNNVWNFTPYTVNYFECLKSNIGKEFERGERDVY